MPFKITEKDAIKALRYGKENPGKVSAEVIAGVLRGAATAFSVWNLKPWRVTAITDDETKQKLLATADGSGQGKSALALFVIAIDLNDTLERLDERIRPGYTPEEAAVVKAHILAHFDQLSEVDRHAWGISEAETYTSYLEMAALGYGYDAGTEISFDPDQVRSLLCLADHVQIAKVLALNERVEIDIGDPNICWVDFKGVTFESEP